MRIRVCVCAREIESACKCECVFECERESVCVNKSFLNIVKLHAMFIFTVARWREIMECNNIQQINFQGFSTFLIRATTYLKIFFFLQELKYIIVKVA